MSAVPPIGIIVPTHAHADTLGLSVRSILEQSMGDLEVHIIADGVDSDTRDVMSGLVAADARVRVDDRPKSPRHGEAYRHELLLSPDFPATVGYHGDDDLMLPDHVAVLLELLEEHDFAHPLPILVEPDDVLRYIPLDLADERCREWELAEPPRNAISLTGVGHTLSSYRQLPHGWRQTPAGRWTDHYMWQQYLASPGLRAATGTRATTVKLVGRPGDPSNAGRRIRQWWQQMHSPDFIAWWDDRVAAAVRDTAVAMAMDRSWLEARVEVLDAELSAYEGQIAEARLEIEELTSERDVILSSRSWRWTAPLRQVARMTQDRPTPPHRRAGRNRTVG